MSDVIGISSGYGAQRKAYVQLVWGEKVAQLTPDEARAHALRILECAAAAETDAFLLEWTRETVFGDTRGRAAGMSDEDKLTAAAQIMAAFREWRRRREGGS